MTEPVKPAAKPAADKAEKKVRLRCVSDRRPWVDDAAVELDQVVEAPQALADHLVKNGLFIPEPA